MKDKIAFKNFMTILGEIHSKDISDTLKNMYWALLKPYPDDRCARAFDLTISTCKFFPKPSELLDLLNGGQGEQATNAWLRVDLAVKKIGPYQSVDFVDDRAINSTIEAMGGWVQLCGVSLNEWKWKQKEFERLYSTIVQRNRDNYPVSLPGLVEIENTGRGFRVPVVLQLTNPAKRLMLQ